MLHLLKHLVDAYRPKKLNAARNRDTDMHEQATVRYENWSNEKRLALVLEDLRQTRNLLLAAQECAASATSAQSNIAGVGGGNLSKGVPDAKHHAVQRAEGLHQEANALLRAAVDKLKLSSFNVDQVHGTGFDNLPSWDAWADHVVDLAAHQRVRTMAANVDGAVEQVDQLMTCIASSASFQVKKSA